MNVVSERNQSTVSEEARRTKLGGTHCIFVNGWPCCLLKHCFKVRRGSCGIITAIFTHPAA